MKTKKITTTALLAILCPLLLTGCGVKPDKLSSPDPADKSQFPATYPRAVK